MPEVAIIGNGPAGLIAGWAAMEAGANVHVYCQGARSRLSGAQYLHRNLPGITGDASEVQFIKLGDAAGYARKVYGTAQARTSWARFKEGSHPGWSLGQAYEALWNRLQPKMTVREVTWSDCAAMCGAFDLVVNTAPRDKMCRAEERHRFFSVPIWVTNGAELKLKRPAYNAIVYNGDEKLAWYRMSWLFDGQGAEYAHDPGIQSISLQKPLGHTCDCWEQHPNYLPVGRYGAWDKDQLSSDAYELVFNALL